MNRDAPWTWMWWVGPLLAAIGVALILGSCGDTPVVEAPAAIIAPGQSAQLAAVTAPASGPVSWSMEEASGCGSVTADGVYTAEPCATFQAGVCHALAQSANGTARVAVSVQEQVVDVTAGCPLTDGGLGDCSVAAGGSVQLYARVQYTCHVVWTPVQP